MALVGSPSPTGSEPDQKPSICSRLRCCCSNCFGPKSESSAAADAGNGLNNVKLQRRVLRNDACSTTIEQVFETDPQFVSRQEHSSLVRSSSQEYLDYPSHQHHYPMPYTTTTAATSTSASTQFQPPRPLPIHHYAFPASPKPPPGTTIICSNVGGMRHSHKRRHAQSMHDVAVGKDADSDTKPESSWAKLELLASTTSLSGKQSVAAELRSDRLLSRYERIDRIAMYLFPIFFFLFNVCYWSYYLLLDDVLQDLW